MQSKKITKEWCGIDEKDLVLWIIFDQGVHKKANNNNNKIWKGNQCQNKNKRSNYIYEN